MIDLLCYVCQRCLNNVLYWILYVALSQTCTPVRMKSCNPNPGMIVTLAVMPHSALWQKEISDEISHFFDWKWCHCLQFLTLYAQSCQNGNVE